MNLNMSNEIKDTDGNFSTAGQLENEAINMENNISAVNKYYIIKMLKVLSSIINIIKRKDNGIFSVLVKWFRLYLKLHNIIDPNDKKLLKFYEKSVPTIITYLIGCLQYKPKEISDYHYNLLDILEELIESIQPSVLRKITRFEKETIGCLWTPIELAGDFNTQLKALNIFSKLLNQFDENRQNEELNAIKWTNLNFFQEKLKAVVQATKLSHILENLSRELLNNYNMHLSKTMLVYSFNCVSVTFANKYRFYKPLNLQKFWIDINYGPKTLSFSGRYKSKSHTKYEIIRVILKIQQITMKHNILKVDFYKPGDFSNHFENFSNVATTVFEFTLPDEEKQRLIDNNYIIEYFNNLNKFNSSTGKQTERRILDSQKNYMKTSLKATSFHNKENKTQKSCNKGETKGLKTIEENTSNIFDTLKQTSDKELPKNDLIFTSNLKRKSSNESLKTNLETKNEMEIRPKRSVRKTNKFFKAFLMDESFDDDLKYEGPKKKRKQKRKPRQTKSRYKQVCKVTPTVDLTKIENMESLSHNGNNANENVNASLNDNISETNFSLLNTQRCDEVLRQVADIYEVGNDTYAKPCQSYRNFQTTVGKVNTAVKGGKKKMSLENQTNVVKKRKLNSNSQENTKTENPETNNDVVILRPPTEANTIISPHLFETQGYDQISHLQALNKDKNAEYILSSSSECEEVRGSNGNIMKDLDHICIPDGTMITSNSNTTTPRLTSAMNVSNLSDSDIEITDLNNFQDRQHQQTNLFQDDMILDMEQLIELHNNSNIILKPLSANNKENIVNVQDNCADFQEQIVDDFEDNSDEFDSNYLAPIKEIISDIMANHLSNIDYVYKPECTIYKNREEETSSSDEDVSNLNVQMNCHTTKSANNKIEKVLQNTLVSNPILCQNEELTDNNFEVSTNFATSTTTTCQVTPTAIIMHKILVSAEKSIILNREKPLKVSKAHKCLNDFFANKTNKSVKFQGKSYFLHDHPTNIYKGIKNIPASNKSLILDSNLNKIIGMESGKNETIQKDNEISGIQQSSSTMSNLSKNDNNSLHCSGVVITNEEAAVGESSNNKFRNELFQILHNYNTNMNKRIDSILRQGIKNISDRYKRHFLDITKTVRKKAEENKLKLEEMRSGIGNLVRELEWQYDAFINKSNEFDIHSEMCKRILDSLTTVEDPNFITKEYEDIFKKIHIEQNAGFQNVWQNFLEKQKNKCD